MPRAEVSAPPTAAKSVVIDNGSGLTKAGFGGEEEPRCTFAPASVVGVQPFRYGVVHDWDAMEEYWDQAFMKLQFWVHDAAHAVLDEDAAHVAKVLAWPTIVLYSLIAPIRCYLSRVLNSLHSLHIFKPASLACFF